MNPKEIQQKVELINEKPKFKTKKFTQLEGFVIYVLKEFDISTSSKTPLKFDSKNTIHMVLSKDSRHFELLLVNDTKQTNNSWVNLVDKTENKSLYCSNISELFHALETYK